MSSGYRQRRQEDGRGIYKSTAKPQDGLFQMTEVMENIHQIHEILCSQGGEGCVVIFFVCLCETLGLKQFGETYFFHLQGYQSRRPPWAFNFIQGYFKWRKILNLFVK